MMCLLSAEWHDSLHLGARTKLNMGSSSSLQLLSYLFLKDLEHSNLFFQKPVEPISDMCLDWKSKLNTAKVLVLGWSCLDT